MRFLVSLLLLAAAAAPLRAQKQERTLEDRLTKPDMTLEFDPSKHAVGSLRQYGTGGARTNDFRFEQKVKPTAYNTGEFYGAKAAHGGDFKFSTKDANTLSKSEIPNTGRKFETSTVPVKETWDAGKTAASRDLPDGQRDYLGPESKKLRTPVDPKTMGDWKNNSESVIQSDRTVEKFSNLKQLNIDDIRALLNKNK